MDDKTILYVVAFVAFFVYSLLKDKLSEMKKKKEAELRKEVKGEANPFSPTQVSYQETELPESYQDDDFSYEGEGEGEGEDDDQLPWMEESTVQLNERPRNLHDFSHTHQEVAHHHQERKSATAPEMAQRAANSSPFLSTEDELFSDTIEEVKIEGFDMDESGRLNSTAASQYSLRNAKDAKRAFIYSEIWNKKYC